jgi:hypothetical protein
MSHFSHNEATDEASSSSHNGAHSEYLSSQPDATPAGLTEDNHQSPERSKSTLSHDQRQPISAWDDYPQLPELVPIESHRGPLEPDYAKEVVYPNEYPNASTELSSDQKVDDAQDDLAPDPIYAAESKTPQEKRRRRICGLPITIIACLAIAVVVVLAVGLGVGLHYGLKKSQ